jgi:hypothetical protein
MGDCGSADGSKSTASTRDSPDFGGFRFTRAGEKNRRNSQQESFNFKSPIGTIKSSIAPLSLFRRTPSRAPTKMHPDLPPSVLVINQTRPEKESVTRPIKIKRRGQNRTYPYPLTASQIADEEDDVDEHLTKLYDMRSWDMYMRITEARKNQQQSIQQATGANAYVNGDYSHFLSFPCDPSATMIDQDLSHLYHEESPEHEMIFGDLE